MGPAATSPEPHRTFLLTRRCRRRDLAEQMPTGRQERKSRRGCLEPAGMPHRMRRSPEKLEERIRLSVPVAQPARREWWVASTVKATAGGFDD